MTLKVETKDQTPKDNDPVDVSLQQRKKAAGRVTDVIRNMHSKTSLPCFQLTLIQKKQERETKHDSKDRFLSSIDQIDILLGISGNGKTEDSSGG